MKFYVMFSPAGCDDWAYIDVNECCYSTYYAAMIYILQCLECDERKHLLGAYDYIITTKGLEG